MDGLLDVNRFEPIGWRCDAQMAVFGQAMQTKMANSRYSIVGSGAIGCEHLTHFAMMGLGGGPNGKVAHSLAPTCLVPRAD